MGSYLSFDKLYYVRLKRMRGEFQAMPKNRDNISLEEMKGYSEGIFPNEKPLEFEQTMGGDKKKPYPIIPSIMNLNLYHSQIINRFIEKGFTGWESYPVRIYNKNGEVIDDYHAFIIKGVCGHYDVKKSKVVDYTENYGGMILTEKRYQGMYFDPETWDGSDIFTMKDTWIDIVTEPVMLELKRLKVNLIFERLSEYFLVKKVEL